MTGKVKAFYFSDRQVDDPVTGELQEGLLPTATEDYCWSGKQFVDRQIMNRIWEYELRRS